MDQQNADWVGKVVGGRFKVKRVLGEGGMGIVYEGEQQMGNTVRRVAIKTLHAHLSKDESVLQRFHRECGTVAQLVHPNTIKFYDFGKESDGTLYIAMEFINGQSLDRVLEADGPMSPARAVKILKQVCGALDEAHDLGVIHRDLKPENIVLTEQLGNRDFVKVLDFGIAARTESADAQREAKLTQQGMVLGTPPYMSPEQFTGVELDRRSDVYSLGVLTYELLTGQLPFSANTPWQWATQHMTAQPFPIDQRPHGGAIPRAMRQAVMRALEKEPAARPATAGEFFGALEQGMSGLVAEMSDPTQEMQAAPVFRAGTASALSTATQGGSSRVATQAEMSSTQPIAVPTQKNPLVLPALLVVGALGLGGGAWALLGGKPTDPAEDPSVASASAAISADAAPIASSPSLGATPPVASTDPDPSSEQADPSGPSTPKPGPAPAPGPAPQPAPTPSPKPATGATPKPAPSPAPAAASEPSECGRCESLVRKGRYSSVAGVFAQCTPATQSACRAAASASAESQIQAAVKAKQCSKAWSIISDLGVLGVNTNSMKAAAQKCKN